MAPGKQFTVKDVPHTLKTLFSNKTLMADTMALTFYLIYEAKQNYNNKFAEFQFHITPAEASLYTGTTRTSGIIAGLLIAMLIITWSKPNPRFLSLYNFLA